MKTSERVEELKQLHEASEQAREHLELEEAEDLESMFYYFAEQYNAIVRADLTPVE